MCDSSSIIIIVPPGGETDPSKTTIFSPTMRKLLLLQISVKPKDEIKVSPTINDITNQAHNIYFVHSNKEDKKAAFIKTAFTI